MYATLRQIKKIHTLKSKLSLSDEDYRQNLSVFSAETSKELSTDQASLFISNLEKTLNKINPLPKTTAEPGLQRPGSANKYYGKGRRGMQIHLTELQAQRINILQDLLGWNETRTTGFIKHQLNLNKAVQMLTNFEASKIIVGMQRILSNGDKNLYKRINCMKNSELKGYTND
jgi:hypothetical protein